MVISYNQCNLFSFNVLNLNLYKNQLDLLYVIRDMEKN